MYRSFSVTLNMNHRYEFSFLQTSSLKFPWKIKRVYKGGSLAKGTGIKDNVDLDLSVYIEKTAQMLTPAEFLENRREIVKDVADKFAIRFNWRRKGDFILFLSRMHATLPPALSVRPSVGWSVGLAVGPSHFYFFYQFYFLKSF